MLDPVSGLAFQVPLVREASEKLRLVPAEVWDWKGVAQDQGQEAAQWLSGYLGSPARLLRYVGAPPAPKMWPCAVNPVCHHYCLNTKNVVVLSVAVPCTAPHLGLRLWDLRL